MGEENIGALTSGMLKITVAAGDATPATATPGTDFYDPQATGAPSATELSYVKGLSSAVQTQITNVTNTVNAVPQAIQDGTYVFAVDSGAANAYVITLTDVPHTYKAGQGFLALIGHDNTGASTIVVNGQGVRNILKRNSSGALVVLAAGDLKANQISLLYDDGTQYELLNPTPPAAITSLADTAISFTDNTTGDVSSSSHGFAIKVNGSAQALGTNNTPSFVSIGTTASYGARLIMETWGGTVTLSGASTNGAVQIPANAMVFGIVARVTTAVVFTDAGDHTWSMGIAGITDLWSTGKSKALSTNTTMSDFKAGYTPLYCGAATNVVFTADVDAFASGVIKYRYFYFTLAPFTS
jgi:hypothetical protein